MAKESRRMFAGDLERAATENWLCSDNEKRRETEVYSPGRKQNQICGKENEPLTLTLSPFGGERETSIKCLFQFSKTNI